MIGLDRFPGGKDRVVTFSFDDGRQPYDEQLAALFREYDIKATFHLNGINYVHNTPEQDEKMRRCYAGHEIACHTLQHGRYSDMSPVSVLNETLEDRKVLERIAGYPVVGMSFPSGSWSRDVLCTLREAGILYSRTVDNNGFIIPPDFLVWDTVCHHKNALPHVERFVAEFDSDADPIFYVWGHSYELNSDEAWAKMRTLLEKVSRHDRVWYATNVEVCRYILAQRRLEIAADESMIYNPSGIPVWVSRDHKDVFCIQPNETLYL